MQAACSPARQARNTYRHELRTLTYVVLDEANGGILRNLNRKGAAIQAVAALRKDQNVRLRFELRFPRLRLDVRGQVSWANPSGQCGIRFVDLPARASHQIDEWIFSNLLDSLARDATHPRSIFAAPVSPISPEKNAPEENAPEGNDGLIVSAPPHPVIRLVRAATSDQTLMQPSEPDPEETWLSRPLAPGTLAFMVDALVVIAALLMFVLTFLSIAHELPQWRLALSAGLAAAAFITVTYRALFAVFGRPSLGARLAHVSAGVDENEEEDAGRFR